MSAPATVAEHAQGGPREFHGGYAGADWVRSSFGLELSPFSAEVADILGLVWRGIYHIGGRSLERAHWKTQMVEISVNTALATYDGQKLTELVVLCHDASIRFNVAPCSMHYLRLQFFQRQRGGRMHDRHPTIEQAVAGVRGALQRDTQEPGHE